MDKGEIGRLDPDDTSWLRDVVLDVGQRLGGQRDEVLAFSEALTGCPWSSCTVVELRAVLSEYQRILAAIDAKAQRHVSRQAT